MSNKLLKQLETPYGNFIVVQNDLIGNFITNYGFWEKHLFDIYSKFITPESIIIDAGANIGFHTIQFAKLGKLVYAFEPQSLIFNILSCNIMLNELNSKIKQYRLGLSDKKLQLYMESEEVHMQSNNIHNLGGRGVTKNPSGTTEQVDLIKFDDEFQDIDKVDFIKMDIQGSELYALKGMETLLLKDKPWMLLENYDNDKDKEALNYILSLGYTLYRPMTIFPNEDCICLFNHPHIENFIKTLPIEFKIYKKVE